METTDLHPGHIHAGPGAAVTVESGPKLPSSRCPSWGWSEEKVGRCRWGAEGQGFWNVQAGRMELGGGPSREAGRPPPLGRRPGRLAEQAFGRLSLLSSSCTTPQSASWPSDPDLQNISPSQPGFRSSPGHRVSHGGFSTHLCALSGLSGFGPRVFTQQVDRASSFPSLTAWNASQPPWP